MPTETYPNQRMVRVNRESIKSDFLGIKNANWQAASRDLGAHALQLYLYLASNANNYTLALSPAAIRDAIGMARSTYHDQFSKLISKGYLVHSHGNTYKFYEVPPSATHTHDSPSSEGLNFESDPIDDIPLPIDGQEEPQEAIEINNKQDTPYTQQTNIHTEEVGRGQKAATKEVRITDLLTNGQPWSSNSSKGEKVGFAF